MKRLFALGFLLGVVQITSAQGQLPAKVLAELKASTVFVRSDINDKYEGTGSGFLIKVDGDTGLIVTNEHVVRIPKDFPFRVTSHKVKVVFDSGRKTEVTYDAEILAKDAARDLAILRVKNAKNLPKPLDISAKVEAVETMPVYILGFPFGKALAAKDNPAITISKGSVSSIRETEFGDEQLVQIDGDINPGNSGGPIVTDKGELVGVTVAKISSTNIGFAIAPNQLEKMLNGRIVGSSITHTQATEKEVELTISVELIDPLNKIKEVKAYYKKFDNKALPKFDPKKMTFEQLTDAEVLILKVEGTTAKGTLKIPNKDNEKIQVELFQFYCKTGDNKDLYVSANKYAVRFDPSALAKVGPEPKKNPPIVPKIEMAPGVPEGFVAEKARQVDCGPEGKYEMDGNVKPKKIEAIENKGAVKFIEQIELKGAISPFAMSPDNRFAYFINRTTKKLHRIDMPKRKLDAQELELPTGCENLCLSEDGKTIFVTITFGHNAYKQNDSGQIVVIETEKMTKSSTINIPLDPFEIVEVGKKLFITGGSNQWAKILIVEYQKKDSFETFGGIYQLAHARRTGASNQIITGSNGISPGNHTCFLFPDKDNEKYRQYGAPYHGTIDLGGRFEVFPEEKMVVSSTGSVLSWGETKATNLKYQLSIDKHYNAVADSKNKKLYTTGMSLSVYSLPDVKPEARYTLPAPVIHAAIDPQSQTLVVAKPEVDRDAFVGAYNPEQRDARNRAHITLQFIDLKKITGK